MVRVILNTPNSLTIKLLLFFNIASYWFFFFFSDRGKKQVDFL